MQDPYCYPKTNILKNRLNIHDDSKLEAVERRVTKQRQRQLLEHPIIGDFSLTHLQQIHHFLFQDLYDWAGKIRVVDIAKGNLFCRYELIATQMEPIAKQMQEDLQKGYNNIGMAASSIAYYLSEINAIHPFREGNGRSQREFMRIYAFKHGYILSFINTSKEEMIVASKASFLGDYKPMEDIIAKNIRPL